MCCDSCRASLISGFTRSLFIHRVSHTHGSSQCKLRKSKCVASFCQQSPEVRLNTSTVVQLTLRGNLSLISHLPRHVCLSNSRDNATRSSTEKTTSLRAMCRDSNFAYNDSCNCLRRTIDFCPYLHPF